MRPEMSRKILIVGASKGLGKAFVEGLPDDGDTVIGVSRSRPVQLQLQSNAQVNWIEADLSEAVKATDLIEQQAPAHLSHAHLLFGNWINEVYQSTPFRLEDIGKP
jgi:homoserine O-succinyltransferase